MQLGCRALLASLCLLFASWDGAAAQSEPSKDLIRACGPDVKRLCPFTERGTQKRRDCLREHKSELSKDCIDAIRRSRGE